MNIKKYIKISLFIAVIVISGMFLIGGEEPKDNNNNNNDITPRAGVFLEENIPENEVKVSITTMGNSERLEIYVNDNKVEELTERSESETVNIENGDELIVKGVIGNQKTNLIKETY